MLSKPGTPKILRPAASIALRRIGQTSLQKYEKNPPGPNHRRIHPGIAPGRSLNPPIGRPIRRLI